METSAERTLAELIAEGHQQLTTINAERARLQAEENERRQQAWYKLARAVSNVVPASLMQYVLYHDPTGPTPEENTYPNDQQYVWLCAPGCLPIRMIYFWREEGKPGDYFEMGTQVVGSYPHRIEGALFIPGCKLAQGDGDEWYVHIHPLNASTDPSLIETDFFTNDLPFALAVAHERQGIYDHLVEQAQRFNQQRAVTETRPPEPEYLVVEAWRLEDLMAAVNERIAQGYEPRGSMVVTPRPDNEFAPLQFFQTMHKTGW